ncbi:hypothetical protein U1Q18_052646 [Sarracenia purpurea var. burkii]
MNTKPVGNLIGEKGEEEDIKKEKKERSNTNQKIQRFKPKIQRILTEQVIKTQNPYLESKITYWRIEPKSQFSKHSGIDLTEMGGNWISPSSFSSSSFFLRLNK